MPLSNLYYLDVYVLLNLMRYLNESRHQVSPGLTETKYSQWWLLGSIYKNEEATKLRRTKKEKSLTSAKNKFELLSLKILFGFCNSFSPRKFFGWGGGVLQSFLGFRVLHGTF